MPRFDVLDAAKQSRVTPGCHSGTNGPCRRWSAFPFPYSPTRVRPIRIDRCICSKVPFSELKEIADRKGVQTLSELQQEREFGVNCRLCHPYVRCMLKDGRTVFHEILRDES